MFTEMFRASVIIKFKNIFTNEEIMMFEWLKHILVLIIIIIQGKSTIRSHIYSYTHLYEYIFVCVVYLCISNYCITHFYRLTSRNVVGYY